jgi:hypothetical protein
MPNKTPKIDPSNVRGFIDLDTLRILDRMADKDFMQPVIDYEDAWEVETTHGEAYVVPADVHPIPDAFPDGFRMEASGDAAARLFAGVAQYMPEGCAGEVASATVRRGVYLCRLSAPGYLDCTDWEAHNSAQDAADSLIDLHGCLESADDED